jgi:succinyl-CoA synthetase beta subunit
VEINPLRITANGALALDALVVLANQPDTETKA